MEFDFKFACVEMCVNKESNVLTTSKGQPNLEVSPDTSLKLAHLSPERNPKSNELSGAHGDLCVLYEDKNIFRGHHKARPHDIEARDVTASLGREDRQRGHIEKQQILICVLIQGTQIHGHTWVDNTSLHERPT